MRDEYQIIDEPKPGAFEQYILDPSIILFLSIVVPLFWIPPFHGRVWIPLIWLWANGYFLGSPTLKKEISFGILGLLSLILTLVLFSQLSITWLPKESLVAYLRTILFGIFFFTLYMIVSLQSAPYAIHQYVKEQNQS